MNSIQIYCELIIFYFIFILNNGAVEGRYNPISCQTPDNRPGECILAVNCKFITDTVKNIQKPLHPSTVETLKSYHCGYDENQAKVCCPINTLHYQTINQELHDVTNHRNLHLINDNHCGPQFTDEPSLGKHPWMALISYNGSSGVSFRCSGSLINRNYILTAAQCITELKYNNLAGIRLGEYDITEEIDCVAGKCAPPVQDFLITEVIPHPHYNSKTMENDIGLIRLNKPANINVETVKPICLPVGELQRETLIGRYAIISGWGVTETGYTSTKLLKTALPVLSNEECQSRYEQKHVTETKINVKQMCAGGISGKDSCAGDGGAPLGLLNREAKFVQYGIVSFGSRFCGFSDLPGVYTRIAYHMDWILDNIKP